MGHRTVVQWSRKWLTSGFLALRDPSRKNCLYQLADAYRILVAANPLVMRDCHFDPPCTWKLYHESGIDIDIWKDEYADDIIRRAVTVKLAGRDVRIAELHDLIAMKLRAGRLQDDFDISEIAKRNAIDIELLQTYATPEQLAHFRQIIART